jgi:hypothetical protein
MPASSTTTSARGPTLAAQSGRRSVSRDQASLARVSHRGGRGGRRSQSAHGAAAGGPGASQSGQRGGLARSGRCQGQLHPGAAAGQVAHQPRLPVVQPGTVGGGLQQRQLHGGRIGAAPVVASGGGEQQLFGVEDRLAGVEPGTGDGVHAGTVRAAQLRRLGPLVRVPQGDRQAGGDSRLHDPGDRRVDVAGGQHGRAHQPLGLGAQMPHLPGRPPAADGVDHAGRGVAHPLVADARRGWPVRLQGAAEHGGHAAGSAEHRLCLLPPGRSLLGERARLVLRRAGLQGGLLRQCDRLDRGGRSPVLAVEVGGEHAAAGLDRPAT